MCPDILTLSLYHDDELSLQERLSVKSHLEECNKCRRLMERHKSLSRTLGTSPFPNESSFSLDEMKRLCHRRETLRLSGSSWGLLKMGKATGFLAPAGAVALLVCGFFFGRSAAQPTENSWNGSQETVNSISVSVNRDSDIVRELTEGTSDYYMNIPSEAPLVFDGKPVLVRVSAGGAYR